MLDRIKNKVIAKKEFAVLKFRLSRKNPNTVYTPLADEKSFRILHVLPAQSFDDPIRCSLWESKKVGLFPEQRLGYYALSYVWGQPDTAEFIIVNGKEFGIHQNLRDALQELRWQHRIGKDSSRPFLLWVDAICINQSDDLENSSQIPRMGTIFEQAAEVVIWLGKKTAFSKPAFRIMSDLRNA